MNYSELQRLAERERNLGERSDRAFARLMAGKIGAAYPRRLARLYEYAAGDLDRAEYALKLDKHSRR
jgi:hypothetical protein